MSAASVQPRDAVEAIHVRLGSFPKASRIAIVTDSAIARLQVRGFMTRPYLRVFADAAAFFAWLTQAETEAA